MSLEHSIRILAGLLILLSVLLAAFVSPYWHILTIFVGLNLIQSAFTKFCPAEMIFAKVLFKKNSTQAG